MFCKKCVGLRRATQKSLVEEVRQEMGWKDGFENAVKSKVCNGLANVLLTIECAGQSLKHKCRPSNGEKFLECGLHENLQEK